MLNSVIQKSEWFSFILKCWQKSLQTAAGACLLPDSLIPLPDELKSPVIRHFRNIE